MDDRQDGSTVLFVVTSHDELGDTGRKTGYYLSEVTHPHRVLTNQGHRVEFVSPKGGRPPMDPTSEQADDPISQVFLATDEWTSALDNSLKPDDVNPGRYAGIFFAGGHGTMWDLPENQDIASITGAIYESGGVVGAVCHGPAGLVNVCMSDGSYLVEGKTVVSFTNEEERAVGLDQVVPFLLEDRLIQLGGTFISAQQFAPQVVTCERLVTGQNPASAEGVGLAIAALLKGG